MPTIMWSAEVCGGVSLLTHGRREILSMRPFSIISRPVLASAIPVPIGCISKAMSRVSGYLPSFVISISVFLMLASNCSKRSDGACSRCRYSYAPRAISNALLSSDRVLGVLFMPGTKSSKLSIGSGKLSMSCPRRFGCNDVGEEVGPFIECLPRFIRIVVVGVNAQRDASLRCGSVVGDVTHHYRRHAKRKHLSDRASS